MNNLLYKIQQKLGVVYRPLLIILLSLLIFALGYQNVKPKQYNIRANVVAGETIRAPYTTIDEQKTEENRMRAHDAVADVYTFQSSIRENQLSLIEKYFSGIRQLRKENYSSKQLREWIEITPEFEEYRNLIGSSERTETQSVQFAQLNDSEKLLVLLHQASQSTSDVKVLVANLDNNLILQTLKLSDEEIVNVQTLVTTIISETLATEIAADKVNATQEALFDQLNQEVFKKDIRDIIKSLVVQLVIPTVTFDEEATIKAKETAANQVQSTYILQGQVIVQEGFVTDAEMIRLLNIYGILDNQTKVHNIYALLAVLLIHAVFLWIVFGKWDNRQSKSVKDGNMRLTAYALAFLLGFMLLTLLQIIESNGLANAMLLFPAGIIPMLILPKTDRRTGALAIIFFNLIAIFVLNNQTDLLGVLVPSLYFFFSMVSVLVRVDSDEQTKNMSVISSLLWHIVIIIPLLLAFNFEIFSQETYRYALYMLLSVIFMHAILFFMKPYWEKLLDDRAELTLNELANLNHPLLKKLIEEAPGTYHHSILVANLSANAVEAIQGDSLFTRVASYYHDIGKTKYPLFFVENLPSGMVSPHQMLSPKESADIIIGHVTEGERILREFNMPKGIIDVCLQHHGTTPVSYFLHQEKQTNLDVKYSDFCYKGPIPQSKEMAVIMIADSIEAASRSLKEHTFEAIEGLVQKIIDSKISENQFMDCGLTVHELKIVKQSLITGVAGMFHTRVEYPDQKS